MAAALGLGASSAAWAAGWTAMLANGQALNIVEGSTSTRSGYFLERRYPDGVRDPQFGTGGRAFFTMGSDNSPPSGLQVDATGRILVTGTTSAADGRSAAALLRFMPGGQLDPSWGQQGRGVGAVPNSDASAVDVLPLADGGALLLGTVEDDQNQRAALWRFAANGQLDAGFSDAGVLVASSLPQSQGLSIQQGPDGALMIAVQTGRADKVWLELHRWKTGDSAPLRIARQEFPEDWVGPATLTRTGGRWVWIDASQPLTPPLELAATAPESLWTSMPVAFQPRPAEAVASTSGHAALNPFSESSRANDAPMVFTLDDVGWPALLALALAVLAGAYWWARRP